MNISDIFNLNGNHVNYWGFKGIFFFISALKFSDSNYMCILNRRVHTPTHCTGPAIVEYSVREYFMDRLKFKMSVIHDN